MAEQKKKAISLKRVSDHEIKNGLELVKYLHKNENNPDLKIRLAVLCDVLIRLSNHNPSTFYPRGTLKLCTALL